MRILLLAVLAVGAAAQTPAANTEVFLTRIGPDGRPVEGATLVNVSRSPGYDNQPSFLPDGSGLLFASNRDGRQTDIYRYDIASGSLAQLTRTDESEYSPLVTPDGRSFSVIRVEADGTQRLWRFDLDGSNPRLVLDDVKPVGYHAWIDATRLALFVLGGPGQPSTLQVADTTTGRAETVEPNIGRSLLVRPGAGTVSFVGKPPGGRWVVKELDTRTRATTILAETVDENRSEDCAWLPDGMLLMSSGARLLAWRPGQAGWRDVADFSGAGLDRITRLAVGAGGQLALVAEPVSR